MFNAMSSSQFKNKRNRKNRQKKKMKLCTRFVENSSEKMSKYNLMKGTNFQTK